MSRTRTLQLWLCAFVVACLRVTHGFRLSTSIVARQRSVSSSALLADKGGGGDGLWANVKDKLYDTLDSLDDRLKPTAAEPQQPTIFNDLSSLPQLQQQQQDYKQPHPAHILKDAVLSLASATRDTIYSATDAVTKTPSLLMSLQEQQADRKRLSLAQQLAEREAREAREAQIEALKDGIWDTVDALGKVVESIGETPAKVASAAEQVSAAAGQVAAAAEKIKQVPGNIKATADGTVAGVTRSVQNVKSAAEKVQRASTDVVDVVSGRRAKRDAEEKERAAKAKAAADAAAAAAERAAAAAAAQAAAKRRSAKAAVAKSVAVARALPGAAKALPQTATRTLLQPLYDYQQAQLRVEAAKKAEQESGAAAAAAAAAPAQPAADTTLEKQIVGAVTAPIAGITRTVLGPVYDYKRAQEKIERAKAEEASRAGPPQPVGTPASIKPVVAGLEGIARTVLTPTFNYVQSRERIAAALRAQEAAKAEVAAAAAAATPAAAAAVPAEAVAEVPAASAAARGDSGVQPAAAVDVGGDAAAAAEAPTAPEPVNADSILGAAVIATARVAEQQLSEAATPDAVTGQQLGAEAQETSVNAVRTNGAGSETKSAAAAVAAVSESIAEPAPAVAAEVAASAKSDS